MDVPAMLRPEIDEAIKTHGQKLIGVFGGDPDFCYTVGLHTRGLPEMIIIGSFPPQLVAMCLNHMSAMVSHGGGAFTEGEHDIGWSVPVKIRNCGPRVRERYTIQAGQYHRTEEYAVQQVMLQDKNGKYHDDPDCEWGVVDQP